MTSQQQYLVLDNNEKISLSMILELTSFDLYQTSRHYEVCQDMARRVASNNEEEKFFTNIFSLKSKLARMATALLFFIEMSEREVKELCIAPNLLDLLPPGVVKGVDVGQYNGKSEKNIPFSHIFKLIIKSLMHKVFRLFHRNRKKDVHADILVRGWVEVTEGLFPQEINKGLLCIYPFGFCGLRQIKFIRSCSKKKVNYILAGLPYEIFPILKDIISCIPAEFIMFNAELKANRSHAKELASMSPRKIYSSDEYEAGVLFLYEELREAGVYIVNSAHGVGQYCPYICYSEFRVISQSQADFYKLFNDNIDYNIIEKKSSSLGIDDFQLSVKKNPAIVLIHQPFKESMLYAEDKVMHNLDIELEKISTNLSIPYYIKMHPNYSRTLMRNNTFVGENVYEWDSLNEFRAVFVTINSTVYFEIKGVAPVFVYLAPTFSPSLYFPGTFSTISQENLEQNMSNMINVDNWIEAAARHAFGAGKAGD